MARHRDIRNMDYEDEYDGYDDVYGHSVDDDYYISPSNRQFIYNRESSRDSRFEHTEENIQEADESEDIDELSDTDRAKVNSCIDQVNDTLGHTTIPKNDLTNLIMKYNFNIELILNAILEDPKYNKPKNETIPKGKKNRQYLGKTSSMPNVALKCAISIKPIGSSIQNNIHSNSFVVPNIFTQKSPEVKVIGHSGFKIPNIFPVKTTHFAQSQTNKYNSLSELVSNHLKKVVPKSIGQCSEGYISKKLNGIKLDNVKPISNHLQRNVSVDLSNALNASNSLQNLKKSNTNLPEKFEMPFIDCDINRIDNTLTPEMETLPCELNTKDLKIVKVAVHKKASKFGSVMCSTYKHPKLIVKSRKNNLHVINVFTFDTMSPDDFISFHLKK